MRHFLTPLLAALLLLPSAAFADAISSPPDSCPTGSVGIECHGPETCRIAACDTDADCMAGMSCVDQDLCVESHGCGGITGSPTYDHVAGPCSGGACVSGTCETRRVCVGGTTPPPGDGGTTTTGDDGGCCSVSGGGTAVTGTLLMVACFVLLRRKRARE